MSQSILVVDDEPKIVALIEGYLEASGYGVTCASDGLEALAAFNRAIPDCVILDVNMPGLDGLDVAREVRKSSAVPIIFLSARADETDRIVGLELGADDYVSKPFSPRELVARVRAILRRTEGPPKLTGGETAIRRGGLSIDILKRTVAVSGEAKALTAAQFDILAFLARSPGRVYDRLEILEATAGDAYEGYERTIDAQVKNIRRSLGDDSERPRFIGTVRGVGYRFIEGPDEA